MWTTMDRACSILVVEQRESTMRSLSSELGVAGLRMLRMIHSSTSEPRNDVGFLDFLIDAKRDDFFDGALIRVEFGCRIASAMPLSFSSRLLDMGFSPFFFLDL